MKVYTYFILLAGMSVLLSFAGISTGISLILTQTGLLEDPSNFANSNFFTQASAIFTTIGVGGIIVGLFTRQSTDSILKAGFTLIILSFVADYVNIMIYLRSAAAGGFASFLVSLVFIPIIVGYVIAVIEWWSGSD